MRPRAGLLFRQPVPASGFQRPRGIFPDSGRLFHGPEQFLEQSVQTGLYASHSLSVLEYSIKLAEVKHVYKNSFTPLVLLAVGTGFLLSITNYLSVCQNNPEWNMHKILASYGVWNISWPAVRLNSLCPVFGALLLMTLGIWLEKKIPVARKLSNYAPACFLIFVLHYPLIMLIPSHIWKQSFFAPFVLIPAIIFLIVAFYLFLRKFFPACLPYVANDRITHVPKKN